MLSMFMLFAEPRLGASCAADGRLCSAHTCTSHSTEEKTVPERLSLCEGHTEPWSAGPVSPPALVAHENRQRRPVLHWIHQESLLCSHPQTQ